MCAAVCCAFHQAEHRGGFGARDWPLKHQPGKPEQNTREDRATWKMLSCNLIILLPQETCRCCKAGVRLEAYMLCVSIGLLLYLSGCYSLDAYFPGRKTDFFMGLKVFFS